MAPRTAEMSIVLIMGRTLDREVTSEFGDTDVMDRTQTIAHETSPTLTKRRARPGRWNAKAVDFHF
jgi:hypothetical protein